MLGELRAGITDHVAVNGLILIIDEPEGYAYLRARPETEGDEGAKIPRLMSRRSLSLPVSLLLALLRKKLAESGKILTHLGRL